MPFVLIAGSNFQELLARLVVHLDCRSEGILGEDWLVVVHVTDADKHLSLLPPGVITPTIGRTDLEGVDILLLTVKFPIGVSKNCLFIISTYILHIVLC